MGDHIWGEKGPVAGAPLPQPTAHLEMFAAQCQDRGDRFATFKNIESLCRAPGTYVALQVNYITNFGEKLTRGGGIKSPSLRTFLYYFWPCHVACRILFPPSGTEPRPLAVRAQSPNHWTAREFPHNIYKF